MSLLQPIVRAFIDVFGITRPTPAQEKRATQFIAALLIMVVVLFVLVGYIFIVHAR